MSNETTPYTIRLSPLTPTISSVAQLNVTEDEMRLIDQVRRLTREEKPFRLIVESDGRNLHLWEGKRAGVI